MRQSALVVGCMNLVVLRQRHRAVVSDRVVLNLNQPNRDRCVRCLHIRERDYREAIIITTYDQ